MRRGAVVLLLALAACVRLAQPSPQIRDYRLDYPSPSVAGTRVRLALQVPAFRVAAVYDRQQIVYREDEYATGTYFYHRWSANPRNMITDLLVRDLTNSGLYDAVQQGVSLLPTDYQLRGEIDELEERISSRQCAAHLALRVQLIQLRGRVADPVRLNRSYSEDEPCTCDTPLSLAAAMSRVMERISARLQEDLYTTLRTSPGGAADDGHRHTVP